MSNTRSSIPTMRPYHSTSDNGMVLAHNNHDRNRNRDACQCIDSQQKNMNGVHSCRTVALLFILSSVVIAFVQSMRVKRSSSNDSSLGMDEKGCMEPLWQWDNNLYIPNDDDSHDADGAFMKNVSTINSKRPNQFDSKMRNTDKTKSWTLLVHVESPSAQNGKCCSGMQEDGWPSILDISSKPNRAYALKWGMDYVQYRQNRPCFRCDLSQQPNHDHHPTMQTPQQSNDATSSANPMYEALFKILTAQCSDADAATATEAIPMTKLNRLEHVQYDVIFLISQDSIITEMDQDFVHSIFASSNQKLLATSNEFENSISNVLLFNLRHPQSCDVAKRWETMLQSNANNATSTTNSYMTTFQSSIYNNDDHIYW
eukprot:CAMPEP_0119551114 /NCGR_PEP_ID=MMETSP1352-20130426/4469_1 /TAXON_ID=265584 /ORGANISM="Stauroneis constricta, Strain CCMP1120" /LENGTH=370 /DNA_ID=CAMNT_0007597123 /DNA_START=144 /DNA_END=1253 /DNA_ORIENTATION=-